jgi:hypothetical protein
MADATEAARHVHGALGAVISRSPGELTRRSREASRRRHVIMVVIGLAVAAGLARDSRGQGRVIMLVMGAAAAAGLARESLAGLAAWYKRRG